jgi:hypothetical protein
MTTCIITGCALVDGNRALWGDLHSIGESWVFNGVLDSRGNAAWEHDGFLGREVKALEILPAASAVHYAFERRGVVVVPKAAARLNQPALAYVLSSPHGVTP